MLSSSKLFVRLLGVAMVDSPGYIQRIFWAASNAPPSNEPGRLAAEAAPAGWGAQLWLLPPPLARAGVLGLPGAQER